MSNDNKNQSGETEHAKPVDGNEPEESKKVRHEVEHQGSMWTHPYMIYVLLTAVLFGGLLFVAWLAWTNGWIPSRGGG